MVPPGRPLPKHAHVSHLSPSNYLLSANSKLTAFKMACCSWISTETMVPLSGSFRIHTLQRVFQGCWFYVRFNVCSFVDPRRFGRWLVTDGSWDPDRSPCPVQEHNEFVQHIVKNIDNRVGLDACTVFYVNFNVRALDRRSSMVTSAKSCLTSRISTVSVTTFEPKSCIGRKCRHSSVVIYLLLLNLWRACADNNYLALST